MTIRILGATLLILGCGGLGFSISASYKSEIHILKQLLSALDTVSCELQYRLSSLSRLSIVASENTSGCLRLVFLRFAEELDSQVSPDAECCMHSAISGVGLPSNVRTLLGTLGRSLGKFDVVGQLKGIENVQLEIKHILSTRTDKLEIRLRGYQTLGLCAGAAIAILLI